MTEWIHFHFSLSCAVEGNGNPLQCSCLENPRDGGAWWAAVCGVAQSRTRLKWLSSSRLVISSFPRSKRLLISWLQSPSAVILEPPKIKSVTVSTVSPSICHEVMGPDVMILDFWNNHRSLQRRLYIQHTGVLFSTGRLNTPSCDSVKVLVTQSFQLFVTPMDCSLLGSSVHGILQARILEWVAVPFSRGPSRPRDQTWVSCIASKFFTIWATSEVLSSSGACLYSLMN